MNPILVELGVKAVEIAADVIEKSLPKNAADDQRELDHQRELEHVAVLGGEHD